MTGLQLIVSVCMGKTQNELKKRMSSLYNSKVWERGNENRTFFLEC